MQPATKPQSESAFERCARELEAFGKRVRVHNAEQDALGRIHRLKDELKTLESKEQAIREHKWFYGFRADKESYAAFQKRKLENIASVKARYVSAIAEAEKGRAS